jgi:L-ascorbate metabolism protein UlaG (beta-lactamase superfamily)
MFAPAGLNQSLLSLGVLPANAIATRDFLKPKHAIPIHYGTFPVLRGTPEEYMRALGQPPTKVHAISQGDKLSF